MLNMIKRLAREERGQGMTEYGLILGILVVGIIIILVALYPKLEDQWKDLSAEVPAVD